ncbi:MAG: PEP/pyruvate-binding domain-containing protein [Alphaproteobacteria bacterium]|nr:PEP/pyruvate-binding domain-containing protein [Alphaproteobacteria bacterium]
MNRMTGMLDILSLNSTYYLPDGIDWGKIAGGKFAGLANVLPLIQKYRINYRIDIRIPQTYAITTGAFRRYNIAKCGVPDVLIDDAVRVMKICGGNVAVRSSANIEDQQGRTYSGAFKSVLSVQNRAQMKDALNTVYASLNNEIVLQNHKKSDLAMGVVIQQMVSPQIAGVAYSETWYKDPFDVINYVKNDVADNLVMGRDNRAEYFAVGKAIVGKNNKEELLDIEHFNDIKYDAVFQPGVYARFGFATVDDRTQHADLFKVAALANSLEYDLGYPVDMEFAIDKNNCLNVLQVRPYVLPTFYTKTIDAQTLSLFAPGREILTGPVYISDSRCPKFTIDFPKDAKIIVFRDEQSVQFFTPKSIIDTWQYIVPDRRSPFSAQHNHIGNMTRENLDFTMLETFGRNAEFAHIKNGDLLNVNLLTGKVFVQNSR